MSGFFVICLLMNLNFMGFSNQKEPVGATSAQDVPSIGKTYALMVGISQYDQLRERKGNSSRVDAEAMTVWLRGRSGGFVPMEQISLLTDRKATLSRFITSLNYVLEGIGKNDQLFLYFSGKGLVNYKNGEVNDTYLVFADAPASPLLIGSLSLNSLMKSIETIAIGKGARVNAFMEISPVNARGSDTTVTNWNQTETLPLYESYQFQPKPGMTGGKTTHSITRCMLNGLLGEADRNNDDQITCDELRHHLRYQNKTKFFAGNVFFGAFSSGAAAIGRADKLYTSINREQYGDITPVIQMERIPREEQVLANCTEQQKGLYQDFLLSMRLERFFPPAERNACVLFDSILSQPVFDPVVSQLRRHFAAALLDVTQQVLNAYLDATVQEMEKRHSNNSALYENYPQYFKKALALSGSSNFMRKTLEAKLAYFEGLVLRLRGTQLKDTQLIRRALEFQQQAVVLEPEAAYILNELGIVQSLSGQDSLALISFEQAMSFSPTWALPYINACNTMTDLGKLDAAYEYGIRGIANSPNNPHAYLALGLTLMQQGQYDNAAKQFKRAIRMNPNLSDAYYNMGCVEVRQGDYGKALEWLNKAVDHGFDDVSHMQKDEDIAPLRKLPAYLDLEKRLTARH